MAPSWMLEVLYGELTKELGEEIPRLIIDAERAFTVNRLNEFGLRLSHSGESQVKGDPSEDIAILLADFSFRGMGNPLEFSLENDQLKLRVNNPFNKALVCGKILGYHEALVGGKGKLEWTVPQGEWAIDIFITPG